MRRRTIISDYVCTTLLLFFSVSKQTVEIAVVPVTIIHGLLRCGARIMEYLFSARRAEGRAWQLRCSASAPPPLPDNHAGKGWA